MKEAPLSWIEIDEDALTHNVQTFRRLAGDERLLVVVKSNAYGHGMRRVSEIALEAGADWLGVFDVAEALALRDAGIRAPLLVFGPASPEAMEAAARRQIRLSLASPEAVRAALDTGTDGLIVHVKLETGTNRQGLGPSEIHLLKALNEAPHVSIEGAYTHFADIEDTTDHSFAEAQLGRFSELVGQLNRLGIAPPVLHTACTAAALLFPDTYFNLLRVGIGTYGLWPSRETFISARQLGREIVELRPVMSWKTRIAQVKSLNAGEYVGYGRSFRSTRSTRLAVLPVGYANGYDRGLSNNGHVLVGGRRAPVCGRVSMNMVMADVSDIPEARPGSEVVLLGRQGEERISAETMAAWLGTINYEVVTRAEPCGPRLSKAGS